MEEAKSEIEVDRPGEASCLARYSRSILVTQWEEPCQKRIDPSARWLFRFDEVDLLGVQEVPSSNLGIPTNLRSGSMIERS